MKKKLLSSLAIITLLASSATVLLTACGNTETTVPTASSETSTASTSSESKNYTEIDAISSLAAIENAMTLTPLIDYDLSLVEDDFGIKAEDVASFAVKITEDPNVDPTELIIINAVSSEASDRIYDLLNAHLEAKMAENKDYNPAAYAVIEGCTVKRFANSVYLLINEKRDLMEDLFVYN